MFWPSLLLALFVWVVFPLVGMGLGPALLIGVIVFVCALLVFGVAERVRAKAETEQLDNARRARARKERALITEAQRRRAEREKTRLQRRETVPERVRHEVWRRDEGRCVDCGSRERLEFDHIIPLSAGGSNTARNLELRCEACNRRKAAQI